MADATGSCVANRLTGLPSPLISRCTRDWRDAGCTKPLFVTLHFAKRLSDFSVPRPLYTRALIDFGILPGYDLAGTRVANGFVYIAYER